MSQVKFVDASHTSNFFRVLLPGFSNRLRLPLKFVKNVLDEKEKLSRKRTASLVNPNGESWQVDVYRDVEQGVYIGGPGWAEMARAHNLGLGYFLLFCFQGNMKFGFRAFDLTTCEIAYPSIAQWIAKKMKQNVPVEIKIEEEEGNHKPSNDEISSTGNKEKGMMKRDATGGVRFEATLSAYNISKGDINIPIRFRESSGLWEQKELRLKDPKGQLWSIGLHRKRSRTMKPQTQPCLMGKGWVKFARANKLKKGDRCIFGLLSKGKGVENVMEVQIVKENEP